MSQLVWLRSCRNALSRHATRSFSNKKNQDKSKRSIKELVDQSAKGNVGPKHQSPIPKMASRTKHVASLQHVRGRNKHPRMEQEEGDPQSMMLDDMTASAPASKLTESGLSEFLGDGPLTDRDLENRLLLHHDTDPEEHYYWFEAFYDPDEQDDDDDLDSSDDEGDEEKTKALEEGKQGDDDDNKEALQASDADPKDNPEEPLPVRKRKGNNNEESLMNHPHVMKWRKEFDLFEILEDDNFKSPIEGMTRDERMEYWRNFYTVRDAQADFDMRSADAPTHMFESFHYEMPHDDFKREPKPLRVWRGNRPTSTFLNNHLRFLYVSNLPPEVDLDGEPVDLKNPVNFHQVQKNIGEIVGVEPIHVFPATPGSGYVGFTNVSQYLLTLYHGPTTPNLYRPPILRQVEHDSVFYKSAPECTLLLEGLPRFRHTSFSLARALFPLDSEVAVSYGVPEEHIFFVSSDSALIRFKSKEMAESALASELMAQHLEQVVGLYRVRYQRARRYLTHKGYEGPLPRYREVRKLDDKLIVDGDMPTRKFYRSHAGTISLRNLDSTVTVKDLNDYFQRFTPIPRCKSSVEFVVDEEGNRTGQAYIGFDQVGDARRAYEAHWNRCPQFNGRKAYINLTRERGFPGNKYKEPEPRPMRTIDELLVDVNEWKRYVDPKDIELLEKNGVPEHTLAEALRSMRFNNETLGALDNAKREESLRPEQFAGQQYKELVELYVKTLIKCLPSQDDPGDLYKAIHPPDAALDLEFFESEQKRVEEIQRERAEKYSKQQDTY